MPLPPLPDGRPVTITFEILPPEPERRLPEDVRQIEGGKLAFEELVAKGEKFRRTALVLRLPNGDTRERVVFFAEDGEQLRMLGFHRILRHQEKPEGETTVFDSGRPNPMTGNPTAVTPDTYSYFGFCTALGGIAASPVARRAYLWTSGAAAVEVDVVPDGKEALEILGTKIRSRRLRVRPRGGKGVEAVYWFDDAAPHVFLQYRGPGDFLTDRPESATVLIRATSSSVQVQRLFGAS